MRYLSHKAAAVAVVSAAMLPAFAHAAGIADMASAVTFTDVMAAMVTIGTAVVGVIVLWAGIKKVYTAVKGA